MIVRRRGRTVRRVAIGVMAATLSLVVSRAGAAQGVPFVRTIAEPTESCPDVAAAPVSDEARRDAQRLRDEAATSALAGDASGARERLRRAAALDPADPDLAYRLARAHEEMNDARAARAEYCRYRGLASTAQDVAEADARLAALGAGHPAAETFDPAVVRFRAGVARAREGDFAGAEREFTATLERWPMHAATLLDRAAVRTALGQTQPALEDLDRYAAAVPAPAPAALAARDVLRAGGREPLSVMASGAFPGGAQLATGRPLTGALVAAVAIAGVALAMESRTVERPRRFTDPFGNPYTEMVSVTVHPRRALGFSVSAAAILGGAIEGFLHATSRRRELRQLQSDTRDSLRASVATGDAQSASPP